MVDELSWYVYIVLCFGRPKVFNLSIFFLMHILWLKRLSGRAVLWLLFVPNPSRGAEVEESWDIAIANPSASKVGPSTVADGGRKRKRGKRPPTLPRPLGLRVAPRDVLHLPPRFVCGPPHRSMLSVLLLVSPLPSKLSCTLGCSWGQSSFLKGCPGRSIVDLWKPSRCHPLVGSAPG